MLHPTPITVAGKLFFSSCLVPQIVFYYGSNLQRHDSGEKTSSRKSTTNTFWETAQDGVKPIPNGLVQTGYLHRPELSYKHI